MNNITPIEYQIKKAKEEFIIRSKPYMDRLYSIYNYGIPIAIYDFETREVKVSFKLDESLENERKRLENKIDDLRKEIESNIL